MFWEVARLEEDLAEARALAVAAERDGIVVRAPAWDPKAELTSPAPKGRPRAGDAEIADFAES